MMLPIPPMSNTHPCIGLFIGAVQFMQRGKLAESKALFEKTTGHGDPRFDQAVQEIVQHIDHILQHRKA